MEIELLYVPDCPNRDTARDRLDAVFGRMERRIVVREREVRSADEATRLGMRGSPTILIGGEDPFAGMTVDAPGLACRLYRTGTGMTGAPTVQQLIDVLCPRLREE